MTGWDGRLTPQEPELDLAQPVQTIGGQPVRILATDAADLGSEGGKRCVVGLIKTEHKEVMYRWPRDGSSTAHEWRLINVPKAPEEPAFGDRPETKLIIGVLGKLLTREQLHCIACAADAACKSQALSITGNEKTIQTHREVYFLARQAQLTQSSREPVRADLLVDAASLLGAALDGRIYNETRGQFRTVMEALRKAAAGLSPG